MIKRMVIMLVAVAIVFGGIFGFQLFKAAMIKKFITALGNPPQTISVTRAGQSEWQTRIEAIGSLRAVKGADLSLELSGVVESISFNSGDDVAEGAQLLKLRTADDVARLESLQAIAALNEITNERDLKQFKMQAVSQATLDTDAANLKNARAQVVQQQAMIDKKILRAPFAGHLGIRAVDLGQYLSPGTIIVTLQELDPIYVDFFVPQQAIDRLRLDQAVTVHVDAFKSEVFIGKISAINPKVDTGSRNVQSAGDAAERRSQASAGHVCHRGDHDRLAAELRHAAANGHHLQSLRRHRLCGRQQRHRRRGQAATDRATDFHHHWADPWRSGCGAQGR